MKLKRTRETTLYGNNAEELYKFSFNGQIGKLKYITRKVKTDSDGNGYTTNVAIEEHEIELSEVPNEVREDVSNTLLSATEEV